MPYKDTLADVNYSFQRDSAFSYLCNACSRCCHNKAIRVGPYEILRLARHLGMTTTEFIAQHTEAGGTVLRMRDENNRACIFLNEQGCGVHPDRPLACRLYPLARSVDPAGHESFGHLTPHPKTEGVYGAGATVGAYLEQQGAASFFEMGDRYGAVYQRMIDRLASLDADELQRRPSRRNDVDQTEPGFAASPWIDIDKTVSEFCDANRRPVPDDIEGTVAIHIEALETWVASVGN
jgi:uncharacterized protein